MKLVVHGLIDKRAETVGRIEAMRDQLAQHLADLDHFDRCIRIFEPDIDLNQLPSKPVPPPNALSGEVSRFLLHTLRTADVALTTHELAEAIVPPAGAQCPDKALRKTISVRTGHSLAALRRKGFVRSDKAKAGGLLRWSITRQGEAGDPVGGCRNGSS